MPHFFDSALKMQLRLCNIGKILRILIADLVLILPCSKMGEVIVVGMSCV